MGKLENRVALITGAARKTGIGFSIAKKFAEEGAIVIVNDILPSIEERKEDLKNLGFSADFMVADLTKLDQVKKEVEKIIQKYGRIDILCNNAGKSIPPRPAFEEMTEDYFDTVLARNLKTTFIACKAVIPHMMKKMYGRIINISSITGNRVAYRYCVAYAAAKSAVSGLTRALALEVGKYNIFVNAILPGPIDVSEDRWIPQTDKFKFNSVDPKFRWPIHRPGFPEDVANMASFLASEECSWISGAEFTVDGGSTLVEPDTPTSGIF